MKVYVLIIGVDFRDTVLRKPLRRECFMWPHGFRGLRESRRGRYDRTEDLATLLAGSMQECLHSQSFLLLPSTFYFSEAPNKLQC